MTGSEADPGTNTLVLGAGKLCVASLKTGGGQGELRYLGNAPGASLSIEQQRLTVMNADSPDPAARLADMVTDTDRGTGRPGERGAHAWCAGDLRRAGGACRPVAEPRRPRARGGVAGAPRRCGCERGVERDVDGERKFFRPPRRRCGSGDAHGAPVPLARVLDTLVRAGHADLAGRLTWRQIELFREEAQRRRAEEFSLR